MRKMYLIKRNSYEALLEKKDFFETFLYYLVKNKKLYKVQLDDLAVFDSEVVVFTFDTNKIPYFTKEIDEFYKLYP